MVDVSGDERPVAITVVTPTHGRCELVARLLASLATAVEAFAREGGAADVVLVDSSTGDDARRIAAVARVHGARLVRADNDVRKKRNLGVRFAHGEVVLFVDSDCVADERLLVEHAAGHRAARAPDGRPVAAVLGLVALTGPRSAPWRAAQAAGFCDSFVFAARYPQVDWGPCANISYRRRVLRELGGFREHWPYRLGGDDVELGLRVNAAGRAIVSRPGAVVHHDRSTWSTWGAVFERARRWGAVDIHVRAAVAPERLRPRGAGPEIVVAAGAVLAIAGAARRRRLTPLARLPVALAMALLSDGQSRRPVRDAAAAEALRLVFALSALAEATRRGRPGLACAGLHPIDRHVAAVEARRRTAVTAAAVLALAIDWPHVVSGCPRAGASRQGGLRHGTDGSGRHLSQSG